MTRLDKAIEAIDDRLAEIGAGWLDMSYDVFGIFTESEWDTNRGHGRRYQNRLKYTLLSISHLRDDCTRLAKATGKPRTLVAEFVESNLFVDVAVRAGDSFKHGIGGRSRKATILNGFMLITWLDKSGSQSVTKCGVGGMVIVDNKHGVRTSSVVVPDSSADWVRFLQSAFDLDRSSWLRETFPAPKSVHRILDPSVKMSIPKGGRIEAQLPQDVQDSLLRDLEQRLRAT